MLRREAIAAVFLWEIAAVIEGEPQRSRMRLDQHIRGGDLVLQVWPLPGMMGILMATDVIPGPAVKAAFAHATNVVGHQVVAEPVALIGGAPGHAGRRLDGRPTQLRIP